MCGDVDSVTLLKVSLGRRAEWLHRSTVRFGNTASPALERRIYDNSTSTHPELRVGHARREGLDGILLAIDATQLHDLHPLTAYKIVP